MKHNGFISMNGLFQIPKKYLRPFFFIAIFAAGGGILLLIVTHAATPVSSFEAEDGTPDGVSRVTDITASAGHAIKFGTGTSSSGTAYVQPNSVGFLGDPNTLTIIDATHPVADPLNQCSWNNSDGVVCAKTDLTLDHVYIKGGLYWKGSGTLKITNSIIEGGQAFYTIYAEANAPIINISDSTLRWPTSKAYPTGSDAAPIVMNGRAKELLSRNNIYGQPHGVEVVADNSIIDSNWIHDLAYTSTDPHLDGIFIMGGKNITVTHNYVDVTVNGTHATAAIFFQDQFGTGIDAPIIKNNFLVGGAFSYFNENGTHTDTEDNIINPGIYGDVTVVKTGSTSTWINNKHSDGSIVAKPSQ
ncbi:MAG TPA: hypothetical protein VLH38_04360 [Patescibacteria group bacterium]|nr:hypothetical protein [Patescibacteria group bacterium]